MCRNGTRPYNAQDLRKQGALSKEPGAAQAHHWMEHQVSFTCNADNCCVLVVRDCGRDSEGDNTHTDKNERRRQRVDVDGVAVEPRVEAEWVEPAVAERVQDRKRREVDSDRARRQRQVQQAERCTTLLKELQGSAAILLERPRFSRLRPFRFSHRRHRTVRAKESEYAMRSAMLTQLARTRPTVPKHCDNAHVLRDIASSMTTKIDQTASSAPCAYGDQCVGQGRKQRRECH